MEYVKPSHRKSRADPNKPKKNVRCIETGKIYFSAVEAGKDTGICVASIQKAGHGSRKTAGGLHWEYVYLTHDDFNSETTTETEDMKWKSQQ